MGVLDEILNENTFAYDEQGYGEQADGDFSLRRISLPRSSNVIQTPRATTIPTATPSQPLSVGARQGVPLAKALFDIVIKRSGIVNADLTAATGSFTEPLPIILFAASQLKSHYRNVLINTSSAQFMGVVGGNIYKVIDTTVEQGINQAPDGVHRFVYKVADGSYVYIDVTCNQNPYPSLLSAVEGDIFRANYLKYFLQDVTQTSQYSRKFNYIEASLFGKNSNDGVPVLSNVKATDQKDNIVELPLSLWVDKTKGFLFEVGSESVDKNITLSFFVDYAQRSNV